MASATAERAVTLVQVLLGEFKAAGLKQADRFAAVAKWLGMKPRRVRAITNMEAARIAEEEFRAMQEGMNRYLDDKAARMAQQLKEIQKRKAGR